MKFDRSYDTNRTGGSYSSGFTVQTGGVHYISPHTPLGMSASHSHYIKPVPPMYVTVYEESYPWYPIEFYGGKTLPKSRMKEKHTRPRCRWECVLDTINTLIEYKYEENLMKSAKEQVENRKFDGGLEFAYQHCKEVLRSRNQPLSGTTNASEGQKHALSDKTNGDIQPSSPSTYNEYIHSRKFTSIKRLCQSFVDAVEDLRKA